MARIKLYGGISICILFINYALFFHSNSSNSQKSLNDPGNIDTSISKHSQYKVRLQRDIKLNHENGRAIANKVQTNDELDPELDSKDRVPHVVIGILSNSNYTCLRDTQRAIFVKAAKAYKRLDIKVFFLLDLPNPETDKEQQIHNDIVYLNTTEHGWNSNFAKKLYNWYRYAVEHFPDALLIGRMDDDVFVCTPQIFDRLNEVKNPLLYYGYGWGRGEHLDDMFLFIGSELVRRITQKKMCDMKESNEHDCLKGGHAVFRLWQWISVYPDLVHIDERKSDRMVYFSPRKSGRLVMMKEIYAHYKQDFCKHYLLFHKATALNMYELNRDNEVLLNDASRWRVSEQEIKNMKNCQIKNY